MANKKEARFDIIFQGAGKGESNDISFQFSGATLSDAVFSSATSSVEHSNGELGGRYNYYDIENAVFYPTKERLERETRRIFGTAPDTVNFSLIEFPQWYEYNGEFRNYWYREGIYSSPPPPEQFWKVVEITEDNRYKIRTWERMEVFRNTALPGSGIALHQTHYYQSYYQYSNYSDFDKMMADGFSDSSVEPESPGQTLTDMVFSPSPEFVSYKSYMPYPYKVGQHYGIERDTGTGKSLMAVWWGDTYTRVREVALTPAFVLEQPLVSMSCPKISLLKYSDVVYNVDYWVKWKDWIRESNAEIWNVGFADVIPGAEFITEEFGTAIETHYWKGCSNASLSGFLNTNSEIWSGTGKAVAKLMDDGLPSFYSTKKVLTESLISRSEIAFSFDSNNNDEGKNDSATIKYIFLFRADGSVDFVAELPNPVAVPRGCSFDLTTTIDHTPEVLII